MKPLEAKQVMMIDDDEEDIEIFREFVKKCELSIVVHHCNDSLKGIEIMKTLPMVDVLFVDSQMPLISGFEVIDMVKKDETLTQIPIVLISSSFSQLDINKAMTRGAFSCLTKSSNYMVYCHELLKVVQSFPG